MKPVIEKFITILAGLAVTGGLAWGMYLQGRIDTVRAEVGLHSTQLAVDNARYEYIKEALTRIERSLDTKKEK